MFDIIKAHLWLNAGSPVSVEIVTRGRRIFSNSNGEREEMEHAIDDKEIGFIVFSKLTSHDWAQHPRLSAPKESSAIEKLPASQCSLSYLFAARSLTLCCRSLSLLLRCPCGSEGRTINTRTRGRADYFKADRDVGPLPSNLEVLWCGVSFAPTNTHDRPKPRTTLARQFYLPGSGPQPAPRSQLKKQAAV